MQVLASSVLIAVLSISGASPSPAQPRRYADEPFTLGPVPPTVDLRNMVRRHVVRRSCELLDAAAARRNAAFASGKWRPWRDSLRQAVRNALGEIRFGADGPPLNVRFVSRHERKGYVVENVLFESLPGWDVNASVYLPLAASHPPPWYAIVVPVGHSGKHMKSYQIPAQVFARMGYVAVTFDPPGMAGEKQGGNDHFNDGVRCYLTGHSSNRYFVADAIRCIDYLATRKDVDTRNGVGMTGVSGGGTTTMFATLLDDRIRAAGPSCCALPNAYHPVLDVYAPCAETLAARRFADGCDDVDLLIAALPTPVLLMCGETDEVFKVEWSRRIAADVKTAFGQAAHADRFRFFVDPGGHAYTVAMAIEFTKWMDRWVARRPEREPPAVKDGDFEMVPRDVLRCRPRLDGDMVSLNRAMARKLREGRSGLPVRQAAMKLANMSEPVAVPKVRSGGRSLIWFHWLEELMLRPEPDIELPATYMVPARENWKGGAVLYFDDRGRWEQLRRRGMLARMTGFIQEGTTGPAVLTVDLRGWGDTEPADLPYEVAGWGDRHRWIAFVSAALGDPILAMRVRDGLSALAYLRSRAEIDPKRIAVGGHRMGGVVALHVAAIDRNIAAVFSADALATFESLATATSYAWSHEDFFPDVLRHYDLPALAADLPIPTLLVNPLDAAKRPLDTKTAADTYAATAKRGQAFQLHAGVDGGRSGQLQISFVQQYCK